MNKWVTLLEWDKLKFSKAHSIRTLRSWAKTGQIQPEPIIVGREYLVDPEAEHVKLIYPDLDELTDREKEILNVTKAA